MATFLTQTCDWCGKAVAPAAPYFELEFANDLFNLCEKDATDMRYEEVPVGQTVLLRRIR